MEYPAPDDVHAIHRAIVESDANTEPGVRKPAAVESALLYISEGYFGRVPETVHEKAVHLMRLLATDHPYVDGNKRTALNTTAVLYAINGYYFDYSDDIRKLLKQFAVDAETVDIDSTIDRFESCARPTDEIDSESVQLELERLRSVVK